MSDHYETRCPSCGGSDEQGCYADCPSQEVPKLRAEIERLRAALRDLLRLVEEDPEEDDPSPYLFDQVCARARAALGEKA